MSNETEAVKEYHAALMAQLLQSERFVNWFRCNFQINQKVDEENKTVTIEVHECPMEEVERRFAKLRDSVLAENASSIQVASPGDLKKMGIDV